MNLKYPWMRAELLGYLKELSDPNYQQSCWTPGQGHLDDIVHFFFDDTPSPADALGYYLTSAVEVSAVISVVQALDTVLEKHGTALSDQQYTLTPEWARVVAAANSTLSLVEGRKN